MDGITCAICSRAILRTDRVRFLVNERLMLHGACYDSWKAGPI